MGRSLTETRMRIWVARPEPGGARTGRRLVELGHDPLTAPVLAVEPTRAPAPTGRFDGILITSANAVTALALRWDPGESTPVFAVGARTAALVRAAGLAPVVEAAGDAAALAMLVRGTLPPGAALLHVASAERKAEPAATLGSAGYAVTAWIAYAARPVAVLPPEVAAALSGAGTLPLDAVLHYSRRSAATALDLTEGAGLGGAFRALKHYCLSADVAVPLVAAGIPAHFVPERPSEEALLAGLAASA